MFLRSDRSWFGEFLCFLGLHSWMKTRRGNRYACRRWFCTANRAWRPGDK